MKCKLLSSGNDGSKPYEAGDEYDRDGEWIRRQLINGLAVPLDDAAKKVVASEHQIERYHSQALTDAALELEVDPAAIPSVAGPITDLSVYPSEASSQPDQN